MMTKALLLLLATTLLIQTSPSTGHETGGECAMSNSCGAHAPRSEEDFVPVVDVAPLLSIERSEWPSSPDVMKVVKDMSRACERLGFFIIKNFAKGLEETDSLARMTEMLKTFFALPLETKLKVKRNLNNSRGFADDELTKQKRDLKEIFDFGHVPREDLPFHDVANHVMDGFNQFPSEEDDDGRRIKGFKRVMMTYYHDAAKLAHVLMSAISLGLFGNATHFDEHFNNHTSFMRLNYYPLIPGGEEERKRVRESGSLQISRHTDAGALTVLWQSGEGLEVYTGSKQDAGDGKWIPVEVVPDSLTVNIGDMLQVWSGGRSKAAEHRVRVLQDDVVRYSAPFFYNPNYASNVAPIIGEGEKTNEATEGETAARTTRRYRPINWGEFRYKRFLGDYADFGKESQIEDYEL